MGQQVAPEDRRVFQRVLAARVKYDHETADDDREKQASFHLRKLRLPAVRLTQFDRTDSCHQPSTVPFFILALHEKSLFGFFSVQPLCALCLCGVFLSNNEPQRHRAHRGCTEKERVCPLSCKASSSTDYADGFSTIHQSRA